MKNETILHIPVRFRINPVGKSRSMVKDLLNDATEKVCKDAFGFKNEEIGIDFREISAYDENGKYEHDFGWIKQIEKTFDNHRGWEVEFMEVVDWVPVIIKHDDDIEECTLEKAFRDELKEWVYSFYDSYVQLNDHVSATLDREEDE